MTAAGGADRALDGASGARHDPSTALQWSSTRPRIGRGAATLMMTKLQVIKN